MNWIRFDFANRVHCSPDCGDFGRPDFRVKSRKTGDSSEIFSSCFAVFIGNVLIPKHGEQKSAYRSKHTRCYNCCDGVEIN